MESCLWWVCHEWWWIYTPLRRNKRRRKWKWIKYRRIWKKPVKFVHLTTKESKVCNGTRKADRAKESKWAVNEKVTNWKNGNIEANGTNESKVAKRENWTNGTIDLNGA